MEAIILAAVEAIKYGLLLKATSQAREHINKLKDLNLSLLKAEGKPTSGQDDVEIESLYAEIGVWIKTAQQIMALPNAGVPA